MITDSDASDVEGVHITTATDYREEIIETMHKESQGETKDDIDGKIEALENEIKKVQTSKEDKDYVKDLKDELHDLKIKRDLPIDLTVSLGTPDIETKHSDIEDDTDLTRFWHHKVMNTPFVGEYSIDLTNDDSDESVFVSRNEFIRDFCEPYTKFHELDNGFRIPFGIWKSLFKHQKQAVEWLWDIYQKEAGGIEGDEMGLGKTAICSVFIGSLVLSEICLKPTLIICPLTLAQQWIRELHIWCPWLRSILLHSTRTNTKITTEELLNDIMDSRTVIVTNYETVLNIDTGTPLRYFDWGCIICDEGHKIRNHDSKISKGIKKLMGTFRLIVTGSPIQNNLVELWSLFDFAYPGLLGSLDVFDKEFATPIKEGTYAKATSYTVFRAYSSAVALRKIIKPYFIRRLKSEVNANLPNKKEQIIFCNLTETQQNLYEDFLKSPTVRYIKSGNGEFFAGIDLMRKICNHPFLFDETKASRDTNLSCKLIVLQKLLPKWKEKGHRVLIFSQYLTMLSLVEQLFAELSLDYFRVDGDTGVHDRQRLIDFYNSGERFGFLLSTKVGGVGVNLLGADRVVIIDPDWNPSVDSQALERAYRIGQKKDVFVYRMICSGTIEKKMYNNQIFKQVLTNRIIVSPNQKRIGEPQTINDLFSLDYNDDNNLISAQQDEDEFDDKEDDNVVVKAICGAADAMAPFDMTSVGDGDNALFSKHKAKKAAKDSIEKLRQSGRFYKNSKSQIKSNELISRLEYNCESQVIDYLATKIIGFIRENNGKAHSSLIVKNFETDAIASKYSEVFRTVLHRVAVLNKRTKTWYLTRRFA